jgi:hypothetical protein
LIFESTHKREQDKDKSQSQISFVNYKLHNKLWVSLTSKMIKNKAKHVSWFLTLAASLLVPSNTSAAGLPREAGHVRRTSLETSRQLFAAPVEEVPFAGKLSSSCRTKDGKRGVLGEDYSKLTDVTLEKCMTECKDNFSCEGYEYKIAAGDDDGICHLWTHYGPGSSAKKGHMCFWKQTACCDPPLESACSKEMEPLKCGVRACEYDNYCLAKNAGWDKNECENRCLIPQNPDSYVSEDFNPVRCGIDEFISCEYGNLCLAKEAAWSEGACELTCDCDRRPGCLVACTTEYIPVVCGKNQCEFANLCAGTKAFGFADSQCTAANPESEEKAAEP